MTMKMKMKMKILVIGGTEFFGKILVTKLLDAGHELTLLTRGNNKPKSFWDKINHIQCDRTKYEEFKSKLAKYDFDVVVDNVVNDKKDIESIIDVFASKENPPQYIFCSTVAVYPGWNGSTEERKEEDANLKSEHQHGDDWKIDYANGKRAAEKYLQENHRKMPYTIMRPTVIEGPGDPHKRTWFWMQRIQDGSPIVVSTSDLQTLYRHVSSQDVAQAFFLAVGNEKAYNKTYNVSGEKTLKIEDYVSHIATALGKTDVSLCWIPKEELIKELPKYSLPPFFQQVRLNSNIENIKADLKYEPQKTSEWIKSTVEAFKGETSLSHGYEHREDEKSVAEKFKKNCKILKVEKEEAVKDEDGLSYQTTM